MKRKYETQIEAEEASRESKILKIDLTRASKECLKALDEIPKIEQDILEHIKSNYFLTSKTKGVEDFVAFDDDDDHDILIPIKMRESYEECTKVIVDEYRLQHGFSICRDEDGCPDILSENRKCHHIEKDEKIARLREMQTMHQNDIPFEYDFVR